MLISVPLLALVRLLLNLEAAKNGRTSDLRQGRLSYIGEVAKQTSLSNSRGGSRQNSRLYAPNDRPVLENPIPPA